MIAYLASFVVVASIAGCVIFGLYALAYAAQVRPRDVPSEPPTTGCLSCNAQQVSGFLASRDVDPADFQVVPRPRHAWTDVIECEACGVCWMFLPAPSAGE